MRVRLLLILVLGAMLVSYGCTGSAEDAAPAGETPAAATAEAVPPASISPSSAASTPAPAVPPTADLPAAPRITKVAAGTAFTVVLIDPLSSGTNKAGDQFTASLAEPIVVGGRTIVDKGTKVRGRVVDAVGSGRVQGLASIRLVLTGFMDGEKLVPIVTKPFVAEAEATKGRDAAVVGGAAGVGAAIGALAGGKKGAGIGALVGGASGTGAVLATKGNEVEYGSETRLKFTLEQDAQLPMLAPRTS